MIIILDNMKEMDKIAGSLIHIERQLPEGKLRLFFEGITLYYHSN